MGIESRELYLYTKDHFIKDLKTITPGCIAPIIAIRRIVKKSIEDYCKWNCSKGENCFSNEDFQEVSNKIYDEIMEGDLS